MNENFEDLQKLIALKRFEQPPEDFVEDFLREFHFRQRQVAFRPSQTQLFWEKLSGFFDSLSGPAWGAVGAAAAFVVASLSSINDSGSGTLPSSHGLKPVDYHRSPEEAAFKATPFIFGIDAAEEEQKDGPVNTEESTKTKEPAAPPTAAQPR